MQDQVKAALDVLIKTQGAFVVTDGLENCLTVMVIRTYLVLLRDQTKNIL
jgi:hypothetical protein